VAAPDAALWQLRVAGMSTPAVSLDTKSMRWRMASPGVNVVEAREGVIGSERIESHQWRVPTGRTSPLVPIALSGDRVLALEPRSDLTPPITNPLSALFFVFASGPYVRSSVWGLGPDGAVDLGMSRLELECHRLPSGDRGACQIFDASRTRFFTLDAATGRLAPAASLPGRFFAGDEPQGGWITGWYRGSPVALRLGPADAIRIVGPRGERAQMLAVSDRAAAGVWHQVPIGSGVRVEPIYQTTATAIIRVYAID
jgi:hypothetical protein